MDSGSGDFEIEDILQEKGVVIVDPSRLFRDGMKRLLETTAFRIVAEGRSLDEMMPELRRGAPGTRLLIVKWYEGDPEFLRSIIELNAMGSIYQIVAINERVNFNSLVVALRSGVKAFLLKDLSTDGLIESLRLVAVGETVFPTELAALLISGSVSISERVGLSVTQATVSITSREVSMLRCLIRGQPNKVIAFHLDVAESTLKIRMKHLFRKINVGNRTSAAIWAMNHGLDCAPGDGPESDSDAPSDSPATTSDRAILQA